jgi:hypothetical protein
MSFHRACAGFILRIYLNFRSSLVMWSCLTILSLASWPQKCFNKEIACVPNHRFTVLRFVNLEKGHRSSRSPLGSHLVTSSFNMVTYSLLVIYFLLQFPTANSGYSLCANLYPPSRLLFKTQSFEDWNVSPSSGRTCLVGPDRLSRSLSGSRRQDPVSENPCLK